MDINHLRIAVTLIGLVLFLALVRWAWARHRQADFDDAARLPFLDSEPGAAPETTARTGHGARA
jgi:cytochrome c oxidase cbb3-type subunit 4